MLRIILYLTITFFITNCIKYETTGSEVNQSMLNVIKVKVTSKQDIISLLGEPNNILNNGNTFIYNWQTLRKMNFIIYNEKRTINNSLIINFDNNEKVENFKLQ